MHRHTFRLAVCFTATLGIAWNTPVFAQPLAPATAKPYILVAAPRETKARGERDYGPVAAFLTRALGHPVVYKHPNGWLTYELWLWKDHADIYFDGPQFVAWGIHHLNQTLGPRVPQTQDWRLYTWRGSPITNVKKASDGAILCAPPVPNFGTLWVTNLFQNPSRQPYLRNTRGWKPIYDAVLKHTCTLGIGPRLTLHYLDPNQQKITILKKGPHYPNQGFSISAQLPPAVRAAIVRALLSPAGEKAMMRLRTRFSHGRRLILGHVADYKGVDTGLDAQWGTVYAAGINHYLKQDAKREGFSTLHLMSP
ncbi:MAG: phosphate/phosphite/phosphonate ABC transporter substrate-binding protein [Acidiferrobacter sp.]